jgi:mRNA interferase MazF
MLVVADRVVICPITPRLTDAPVFRLTIEPAPNNGLKTRSQLMVDKLIAVKREQIDARIGRLNEIQMAKVNDVLRMWLELGTAE